MHIGKSFQIECLFPVWIQNKFESIIKAVAECSLQLRSRKETALKATCSTAFSCDFSLSISYDFLWILSGYEFAELVPDKRLGNNQTSEQPPNQPLNQRLSKYEQSDSAENPREVSVWSASEAKGRPHTRTSEKRASFGARKTIMNCEA